MMGTQTGQDELFSYRVNLDERVRADHPLRAVQSFVDFTFVREEVAGFYGGNGNPSVDPVIVMKMFFLLFFEAVPSARELMRIIPERLDYLWFLGYGLDATIPDHSVLSKARKRWGSEVFESLFLRVLFQCVEAGLVRGDKIHVDASFVRADASRNSVVKGSPELIGQLRAVYQETARKLAEERGTVDAQEVFEHTGVNETMCSRTDPDAALARHGGDASVPRYKSHRVVDDYRGVITATEVTPGDVAEGSRLMGLIEQHEHNCGICTQTVVADSAYGTVENYRDCYGQGIRCHMADNAKAQHKGKKRAKSGSPAPDLFPASDFVYDEQTDTYHCPAGQRLECAGYDPKRKRYEYKTRAKTCAHCPLRPQCTRAKDGAPRSIKRHLDHDDVEAARAQAASVQARKDRVRRKWLIEGSFADATNNHRFKRARWRNLHSQRIQDLLVAIAQNVRILIRHAKRKAKAMAKALKAAADYIRHPSFVMFDLINGIRNTVLHPSFVTFSLIHSIRHTVIHQS